MTEDVFREIVETADEWAKALVSNDATQIGRFMSDDWVIVSETGISPKEHLLPLVRSGRLSHSAMQRISDPHVRVHGDTAILTARVTNTAHFDGRMFEADEWTTDVFVRDGDKWLCVQSHITSAKAD